MRLLRQARQAYALLGPPVLRKTLYAIAPFAGDKKAGCRFSGSLFSICKGNPLAEKMALRQPFFSQTAFFQGNIPSAPQSPMGRAFSPAGSVGAICLPLADRTPFSPWMRKGGKRIRWAGILTRQAKSSCKQACGCISKAVRVDAASLLIQ